MIGDRLRMIAGGHRNDPTLARPLVERGELVDGAALLERVGDLEVFVFDLDLGSRQRRKFGRR